MYVSPLSIFALSIEGSTSAASFAVSPAASMSASESSSSAGWESSFSVIVGCYCCCRMLC